VGRPALRGRLWELVMTLEEQFSRLIQILQLIDREPWVWDSTGLETKFDVSRSTIERDIAVLRQWGQIKRKGGKFGLAEMKFLPTSFTPPEALALRLAGTAFESQAGAAYKQALASALKKIDLVLPRRTAAEIRSRKPSCATIPWTSPMSRAPDRNPHTGASIPTA
jgi:predicted DNA-binding transcriptional regulator YafY